MNVLGIETTCDETAAAVVADGETILTNVVRSQIEDHRPFGGVVPELACRKHLDYIVPVVQEAMQEHPIDLVAVAQGPGLVGALLVGINTAKGLALALQKPLIGVNHIEAHLYAATMNKKIPYPALGIVLSGGHTTLIKIDAIGQYTRISETVDDAIGEAFDKVAAMLHLPYPGGPEVEKLARKGDPHKISLHAGQVKEKPLHFSFSGLKTAVRYALEKNDPADLAASFQHAAFSDIVKKSLKAAEIYNCQSLIFGGGVTNNQYLRELFQTEIPLFFPPPAMTLDNAAMIAGLGYVRYQQRGPSKSLSASPSYPVI